jgi:DNA-binding transcriptional ArsR family regulator
MDGGPAAWWRALAPELAGQPSMILARRRAGTGRVEYDHVAPLASVLPEQPAALRVFDHNGMASVLWLDFDPGRAGGGTAAVERDAAAATRLIRAHGGLVIEDTTARGGRHVIAPLATPVSKQTLEPILRGLADRYPTLDVSPTLNIARGCMAPPGALTRRGERRHLLTPLAEAHAAVTHRSAPDLLDALRALLPGAADPTGAGTTGRPPLVVDERAVAVPGGPRTLSALARGIVERGIYPAGRYPSGSEARQGALVAAACRGWCLAAVVQQMTNGAWPGLTKLYSKYGNRWKKALSVDWSKALLYAANRPARPPVAQANTRGKTTSRGAAMRRVDRAPLPSTARAEHRFVRRAYGTVKAVSLVWARDESGWTRLAVILAGIAHAHRTGSRVISSGSRSLTLIAGLLSHSTIATVLRAESEKPDGWFRLIQRGRGDRPDRYELVIPQQHTAVMDGRPLPTGRLGGVHPVFAPGLLAAGVGLAAWQVIEAVTSGASTVPAIIEATGVSRAHAYRILRAARDAGLVAQRADRTWRRTRRSLDRAGRHVGLADRIAERRQRYDRQRRLWRMWLAGRGRGDWHSVGYRRITGGTAAFDVPLWPAGWEDDPPPDGPDPPGPAQADVAGGQRTVHVELPHVRQAAPSPPPNPSAGWAAPTEFRGVSQDHTTSPPPSALDGSDEPQPRRSRPPPSRDAHRQVDDDHCCGWVAVP